MFSKTQFCNFPKYSLNFSICISFSSLILTFSVYLFLSALAAFVCRLHLYYDSLSLVLIHKAFNLARAQALRRTIRSLTASQEFNPVSSTDHLLRQKPLSPHRLQQFNNISGTESARFCSSVAGLRYILIA